MPPKTKPTATPLRNKAFTLIELMIVVAIVSLLASFGVPAYQDYIRKTRVAEAIQLVSGMKAQITENAFLGKPLKENVRIPALTPYLTSISVWEANGEINLMFNPSKFNGNTYGMSIVPKDSGVPGQNARNAIVGTATSSTIPQGSVLWGCRSDATTGYTLSTIPAKYVPEACKANPYN